MRLDGARPEAIARAAELLRAGEAVAFPTETVYGLGANARDVRAVARIYQIKQRPADHPLIVHLGMGADIESWSLRVGPVARCLIDRFWPGPLTLILERLASVDSAVAGGQDSIGLRQPSHPVAQALLEAFSQGSASAGIAAPSANRFGRISPTRAEHVADEFGDQVTIVDGGASTVGIESTIIDLTRESTLGAVLLRPGSITRAMLAQTLGYEPSSPDRHAPRVSGALAAHYAPRTPLRLVNSADLAAVPEGVASWTFDAINAHDPMWRKAPDDAIAYAFALYAVLRSLDAMGAREIWVERPPGGQDWDAVRDRLARAAAGSGI